MAEYREHGNYREGTHKVRVNLDSMHRYLMYKKIPYLHVSVVHVPTSGFMCVFAAEARDLIDDEIIAEMEHYGLTYTINK